MLIRIINMFIGDLIHYLAASIDRFTSDILIVN